MYRRRYLVKTLVKAVAIAVVPQVVFLVVVGSLRPPDGPLAWLSWILGSTGVWLGALAGLAQLFGSSLPQWVGWDVFQILDAFDTTTNRTLSCIRDQLPVAGLHLERGESQDVWDRLQQGNPVLLYGDSGSGKSGIAATIVRQAIRQGIPTLFLDTRNYADAVSSFGDLEKYVHINHPLRDCVERLGSSVGDCLLVIDQLDSVVGKPAYQISIEVLAGTALVDSVKTLAVSCLLETSDYEPTRNLGFQLVESRTLERSRAESLLREVGVHSPTEAILSLAENLFFLSLVVELSDKVDINQVEAEAALLEQYLESLTRVDGAEVAETALSLSIENLSQGKADFSLPRDKDTPLQRLLNRGWLIHTARERYRFRHEQLLYYLYARASIERGVEPSSVLAQLASQHIQAVLVWFLRLYHYDRAESELAAFLLVALTDSCTLYFYDKASLLDEMLRWNDVSDFAVAVHALVQVLASDSSLERYFYQHLSSGENVIWFEPLQKQGCFHGPPKPITVGNTTSYPPWFAASYLVAVAPKIPEMVVAVARDFHPRSPFDFLDFTRVARRMPSSQAAQIVPTIIRWAREGMRVEKEVISLAIYLAQEERWGPALNLVDLVLSPRKGSVLEDPQQNRFSIPEAALMAEDYVVQMLVEGEPFNFFLDHRPLEVLRIVQKNLEQALEIEGLTGGPSCGWRPAIEPHEQNLVPGGIKNRLVDSVEHALRIVGERMPDQARSILEEYLQHDSSILRRLAIHTIRLYRNLWPDLWERLFTEPEDLEDVDVHHEYWLLMHDTFGSLPALTRESFVERLLGRLPSEEMRDQKGYDSQRYWVLKQMWAIDDSLLPTSHQETLEELVAAYGERERQYASFLSYSYGAGWVSTQSPTDLDQLAPEEIVSELRKSLPFHSLDEPSHEGLARALKDVIVAEPQHLALMALELFAPDIPPLHTYYALWGFRDAWNADRSFDWAPVLALCERVSRTIESVDTSDAPPDLEPDYWDRTYANARTSVADLLQAGVVRDDHAIPPDYLSQARDILLTLADDPNPTPEYEARWSKEYPRRVLDFALNVTRGRAVEALIQYALHFARFNAQQQDEGQEPQLPQSRMEDVVKDKLTEKLDKRIDPSLAVHSLFGKYLPNLHYLDKEWLIAHLEDIFPRQPTMADYWEAAWEGYLFRGDFFGYMYEFLRPYYRHALEQLALGMEGKAGSDLVRGRLARHFSALYWRGIETLQDQDSLLPLFFDAAPDELRTSFVRGLETGLEEVKPAADSQEWQRAKALWMARTSAMGEIAQREGNLKGFIKELGAYAGWVSHVPSEELEDLSPQVELSVRACDSHRVHEVIELLPSILEDHANLAMRLLEVIVEQLRDRWFMASEHEVVLDVLEAAMDSGDEEMTSSAVRVINLFGERGDERYRPLLGHS